MSSDCPSIVWLHRLPLCFQLLLGSPALLLVLLLSTSARAAGDPTRVVLGYEPGSPATTVDVQLTDEARDLKMPLFVWYTGAEPLQAARLYTVLRDDQRRPVTSGNLQFVDPAQNDAPLGALDFQPNMPARQIVLRLSDFSAFGTLTGFIGVDTGGTTSLVKLKVMRPASPLLRVQEASESDVITLRVLGPQLQDSIFLVETGGKAEQQSLSLNLNELRSANGQSMKVHLNPHKLTLVPYLVQRVEITGTVPEVGEFSGLLVLKYGEQQRTYRLMVQRVSGAQHLSVSAISPGPVILFWARRFFERPAHVPLTISETGGSQVKYYPPRLSKLVQIDQKGGEFSANFTTVLLGADGKPVTDTNSDQPNLFRLSPHQSAQMAFEIDVLSTPGSYQGTVQVATPTGAAATATFNLAVKHGWPLLAVVILLGVGGSYFLRRWLEIGRPAAARELVVRQFINRLAEAISEENDPIRRALVTRLTEAMVASQIDGQINIDEQVQQATVQLTNYLLVRDVLTLRQGQMLERIVPNPAQQEAIHIQLDQLAAALEQGELSALANDDQGGNALVTRARTIREELTRQAQASLGDAITALRQQMLQDREANPALGPLLDVVEQRLNRATGILAESQQNSGQRAVDRLIEAHAAYEQGVQAYRDVHIARFRQMLEAQNTPPAGFDDAGWQQLKNQVLALLPANASAEAFAEARAAYLRGVLSGLQRRAQDYVALLGGALPDPNYQDEHTGMQQIADAAQAALNVGPDQPEAEYGRLRQRFETIVQALLASGVAMDDQGAAAGPPAPAPGITSPPVAGEAPPRPTDQPTIHVRRIDDILAEVYRKDHIAVVITAAVSVVIGLQLLWTNSPTFGNWNDYITGFLWGFGLSEFNKVALPAAAARLQLPFYPATRTPGADR